MFVILAKGHGHLTYLRHGIVTEVIAEGYVDLVGCVDKVFCPFLRADTEPAGGTCQLVQLVPSSACVYLLELLVESHHLVFRHPRVFLHVHHLFVHLGIVLHRVSDGHSDASDTCRHTRECRLVAVELISDLAEGTWLLPCCLVHSLHFGAAGLDTVGKCLVFL